MQESFENPSEIIFFIPKSQFRWMYRIDNGKPHIILQDDVIKFIRKYIDKKYISDVKDIMMRHQPFIIMIEEHSVIELHKEEHTMMEHHNTLSKEIDNVIKYGYGKTPENSDHYMFDQMIQKFEKM